MPFRRRCGPEFRSRAGQAPATVAPQPPRQREETAYCTRVHASIMMSSPGRAICDRQLMIIGDHGDPTVAGAEAADNEEEPQDDNLSSMMGAYLIVTQDGEYSYIGSAKDHNRRLNLHNEGRGAEFTRGNGPGTWRTAYFWPTTRWKGRSGALSLEARIKLQCGFQERDQCHSMLCTGGVEGNLEVQYGEKLLEWSRMEGYALQTGDGTVLLEAGPPILTGQWSAVQTSDGTYLKPGVKEKVRGETVKVNLPPTAPVFDYNSCWLSCSCHDWVERASSSKDGLRVGSAVVKGPPGRHQAMVTCTHLCELFGLKEERRRIERARQHFEAQGWDASTPCPSRKRRNAEAEGEEENGFWICSCWDFRKLNSGRGGKPIPTQPCKHISRHLDDHARDDYVESGPDWVLASRGPPYITMPPLSPDASRILGRQQVIDADVPPCACSKLGCNGWHVSARQAIITSDSKGGWELTSHGTNRTGVSSDRGSTWTWLRRNESQTIRTGDQIALDQGRQEPGTTWVLRRQWQVRGDEEKLYDLWLE